MMGEHGWARRCWEDGIFRYPNDTCIKNELDRIRAYVNVVRVSEGEEVKVKALRENYVYITAEPALTSETCKFVIGQTESYVEKNGWTTTRHYSVPTTDVPVSSVPSVLKWFNSSLYPKLSNFVSSAFGVVDLLVHDAFVVKYDATNVGNGAVSLPWHFDESTFSFTVSLNDGFRGGGTEFRKGGGR